MLHKNGQRRLARNLNEAVGATFQRQLGNKGCGANAGRAVQLLKQLLVKRPVLVEFLVARGRQLDHGGKDMVRLDANVGVAQILERAQEQSGTRQQSERERNLTSDEHVANPASTARVSRSQ